MDAYQGEHNAASAEAQEPTLSVVVPVYNESESIVEFSRRLRVTLDEMPIRYEVLFIDDGSTDASRELIESLDWQESRVISFVTNSGHMAALDAGYRASSGSYVVCLDSDLQHPPSLIPAMLESAISHSVDVVYAVRETRADDGWFKRRSALGYYRLMRALTDVDIRESAADFRLISRRVVEVMRDLPPGQQVFRLLVPSLGFPEETIPYEAAERFAGDSKYTVDKMMRLSMSSIVGFTTKPLTLSIRVGLIVSLLSFAGFIYVLVTFFEGHTVQGWASMLSTVLFVFGVLLVILGVFGFYIGSVVQTLQGRPQYLIDKHRDRPEGRE